MLPNIWILVKKQENLVVSFSFTSSQCVVLNCVHPNFNYLVAFVHASNSYVKRRELWSDLMQFCDDSLITMGDFNAVLGMHERIGLSVPLRVSCTEFSTFIDDAGLIEGNTSGPYYTWVSNANSSSLMASRIDRFLMSPSFSNLWSFISCEILGRHNFDHHPLFINCCLINRVYNMSFRFQKMWFENQSCVDLIKHSWSKFVCYGKGSHFCCHQKT